LLEIIDAGNLLPLSFRTSQCGQQHRRENRDDGNNDKQFDQSESGRG